RDDHDEVDQRPDAAPADRQQLPHTGADLADVEAVHAERPGEDAQEQRDHPRLVADATRSHRPTGRTRHHRTATITTRRLHSRRSLHSWTLHWTSHHWLL